MSKVLIEVSARHVHLSKDDLDFLFGEGFNLEEEKKLSQGDDFASQSTVSLMNGERRIDKVRVLGPLRDKTQVEISRTDAYFLKLDAPLRISGDLEGAGSITIEGPVGRLDLKEGLIVAKRHLHCSPEDAKNLEIENGDLISVKTKGERSLIFNNVVVRVKENSSLSLHIDTDEGNAAGIKGESFGEII